MNAVGYARRSKESGGRTVSLEDQQARIVDYCHARGWQLVEVVIDNGVSGGRRQRLERLAERVEAHGARFIVCYHLDRFARDLAATLDYLRRFSRRGVELHVVGRGQVEADTATGFIVTAVEGLAAEHYRRVISEKTRDALARLRAKGRRVSRFAPYGFRLAPGGRLAPNPKEQKSHLDPDLVSEGLRALAQGDLPGARSPWHPRQERAALRPHDARPACHQPDG